LIAILIDEYMYLVQPLNEFLGMNSSQNSW